MSPTSTNEWREKDGLLGSGGFGNVRLFVNKDGVYLVVKECKQKSMTERMKVRWQNECDIMLKLDSPYIVKSVPLPDELKGFNILSNPVLAMEYCNSGDLRKELNHPHNMFGLEEIQVKAIAHDVSDAIKYLHTLRIYHRDLKPENIVLQKSPGRRIVYKIIDLGYAKEVSQDSICTSFVGTIQYLAPELLSNSKPEYTGSVDYWSLGTTIFECISGFRPFMQFPDMFVWLQVVRSKSDKDIYAYPNNSNSATYSDRLPKSKISSTSQTYFEAWLRLMLMYDPKRRGGMNEKKIPTCHELLKTLFQHKPLHVFDPFANESHYFDIVDNESLKSIGNLSLLFCRTLNIPPGDHFIFMTTTGLVADKDSCLTKYRTSVDYDLDQELEEVDIDLILACLVLEVPEKKKPRTPKLDQMMTGRQNAYDSTEQLKLSKHLTHYCWTLYRSFQHLLKSMEGIRLCLLRERTNFEEQVETLRKVTTMLQSKVELFSESLGIDIEEATKCSSDAGLLLEKWQSQDRKINDWKDLIAQGEPFADKYNAVECKIHECLKRLCVECEREVKIKSHFQTAQDIVDYFRNTTANQADKLAEITTCLLAVEKDFEQFSKESRSHMRTVMGLCKEMFSLKAPIEEIIQKMESASLEITATQTSRQREVWRIVENKKTRAIASYPKNSGMDLSTEELYLKSMDLVNRAKVLLSEKSPSFPNDLEFPDY